MKRSSLILETAVILLLCASGAAISHLWKQGPLTFEIAGAAMIVPAITTALFMCISAAVPELYAVGRLRFPITVTLPLIYGVTLWMSMILMSRVGLSITKVPDRLTAITIWSSPVLLGLTVLAGVLCLSLVGTLARESQER